MSNIFREDVTLHGNIEKETEKAAFISFQYYSEKKPNTPVKNDKIWCPKSQIRSVGDGKITVSAWIMNQWFDKKYSNGRYAEIENFRPAFDLDARGNHIDLEKLFKERVQEFYKSFDKDLTAWMDDKMKNGAAERKAIHIRKFLNECAAIYCTFYVEPSIVVASFRDRIQKMYGVSDEVFDQFEALGKYGMSVINKIKKISPESAKPAIDHIAEVKGILKDKTYLRDKVAKDWLFYTAYNNPISGFYGMEYGDFRHERMLEMIWAFIGDDTKFDSYDWYKKFYNAFNGKFVFYDDGTKDGKLVPMSMWNSYKSHIDPMDITGRGKSKFLKTLVGCNLMNYDAVCKEIKSVELPRTEIDGNPFFAGQLSPVAEPDGKDGKYIRKYPAYEKMDSPFNEIIASF